MHLPITITHPSSGNLPGVTTYCRKGGIFLDDIEALLFPASGIHGQSQPVPPPSRTKAWNALCSPVRGESVTSRDSAHRLMVATGTRSITAWFSTDVPRICSSHMVLILAIVYWSCIDGISNCCRDVHVASNPHLKRCLAWRNLYSLPYTATLSHGCTAWRVRRP